LSLGTPRDYFQRSWNEYEQGAEYTSLSFTEPISTLIHLYWLPELPDDKTSAEVMAALDAYVTTIIQRDKRLNELYKGKSPLQ